MKTEVYSWRVSPDTKSALEDEARRIGASVSEVLDRAVLAWLEARRTEAQSEQSRLREAAMKAVGTVAGGNPRRSAEAKALIRQRLTRRRAK